MTRKPPAKGKKQLPGRITPAEVGTICHLFLSDHSPYEIEATTGRSRYAIRQILKRHNIKQRTLIEARALLFSR